MSDAARGERADAGMPPASGRDPAELAAAVARARRLADGDASDDGALALSDALYTLADGLCELGRHAEARVARAEDIALRRRRAAAAPGDRERAEALLAALSALRECLEEDDDAAAALPVARECVEVARRLHPSGDPDDDREFAVDLSVLGDALRGTGDEAGAHAAWEEALAIAEPLAAADPACERFRRDVAILRRRLGRAGAGAGAGGDAPAP